MNRIELISLESKKIRELTLRVIGEVPEKLWYETPANLNTNIAWQVGHLVISEYYHAIAVISGSKDEIGERIPLKEYSIRYAIGSHPILDRYEGRDPLILMEDLHFVHQMARAELFKLTEDDLDKQLYPTKFPHPIAKTKYEALTWNYQHEAYHMGQIGLLKRILGIPTKWTK